MKFLGALLGLSLLASQATASAKPKTQPRIISDLAGKVDSCPSRDPPCLDRHITVLNPGKYAVKVWFDCGPEIMIDLHADVNGHTKVKFVVSSDTEISAGQCVLMYSNLVKGNK